MKHNFHFTNAIWPCLISGLLLLSGCAVITKIPVKAHVFGVPVDTTVDSESARYFLERYLPGKNNDRALDEKFDALYRQQHDALPSRDTLRTISREFSVDVAALFLADRLLQDPCNRELNRAFDNFMRSDAPLAADVNSYVLLFVPGWDYAQTGHATGSDFAAPRKLATDFGIENVLVMLPPTGSVEENAVVLNAEIISQVRRGKKILLAGASSAGPAIHFTLGALLSEKEHDAVKVWLNLGGILQGSPLIDHFQSWPRNGLFDLGAWAMGWNPNAILSMSTAQSRPRFQRMRKLPEMLIVNYIGIPLSGQISQHASDKYPLLRDYGPNDGLTLLTDIIAPKSVTLVVLGRDHFFAQDPEINRKTAAMMRMVFAYLGQALSMQSVRRCVAAAQVGG